jgi:hypothetical protein
MWLSNYERKQLVRLVTWLLISNIILALLTALSFRFMFQGRVPDFYSQELARGKNKEAVFKIDSEKSHYQVGDTFKAQIKLIPLRGEEIVIASAVLNFDPQVVKVLGLRGGDDFGNIIEMDFDNQEGVLSIKQGVSGDSEAISGASKFAEVEFKAVGSGKVNLEFDRLETKALSSQAEELNLFTE